MPNSRRLELGEVHLWVVDLAQSSGTVQAIRGLLADDEVARAQRLHVAGGDRRFIVAHAALRSILGQYLQCSPATIDFIHNDAGKPALARNGDLTFNLTHSHELAVVAVGWRRRLGVDIEPSTRQPAHARAIVRRFAPEEQQQLATVAPDQFVSAFMNGWVRKEAFLKALGSGLQAPLNSFAVDVLTRHPASLRRRIAGDATDWVLLPLDLGTDYLGTLVTDGGTATLGYRHWSF